MTSLGKLYNADARARADVAQLAAVVLIPHPLVGVEYADGSIEDTTAGHVRCTACRIGRPCKTKRKRTG